MLSRLRAVFWNDEQGRARTPWLIALPLVGAYAALIMVEAATYGRFPLPVVQLLINVAPVVVAFVLIHASRRFLGARRSLSDYGLAVDHRWLVDLLAGLVIGVAGLAIPYVIGIGAGWLEVVAVFDRGELALWPGILLIVFSMFWVGLWEELLLRAVFICNAADGLRRWLSPRRAVAGGVVVSAVVFGVAHFAQAAQTAFVLTWVLSGVVLGVIYVLSGNLALTIGIHAAFNIAYNVLFVRTDVAGLEALSAITRIGVDPNLPLLVRGGVLDVAAWICVGLLGLLWLWYSRGALSVNLEALQVEEEPEASTAAPAPGRTAAVHS